MKNKPTLEEMEAAWRSQGGGIDALAKTMPLETPRHDAQVTLWRSVAAAALAIAMLLVLPPKAMATATPAGSLDKCRQIVDTILLVP